MTKKKKTLFISFDIIRQDKGDPKKSYAMASLLAFLKNDSGLAGKMEFDHLSINCPPDGSRINFETGLGAYDPASFDYIAISVYIWNDYLVNDCIIFLRKRGFMGTVILGGHQITRSDQAELPGIYPDTRVFIIGYGEQSLKKLFTMETPCEPPLFLSEPVDFSCLHSVYLSGEIPVQNNAPMARLETKRGCPYHCAFCAHRNRRSKVFCRKLDKVFADIAFLTERCVKRINIIDPVFNYGKDYLKVMREINRINTSARFTLQCRFENIRGDAGKEFLDFCAEGNYHLEFGLQTSNPQEGKIVHRKNNLALIDTIFTQLQERGISYEVSLIYGLPGQTLESFKRSIDYVRDRGCKIIKAFPLMLLPGTELCDNRTRWNLQEETLEGSRIPLIVSSDSFTRAEWERMWDLAVETEKRNEGE